MKQKGLIHGTLFLLLVISALGCAKKAKVPPPPPPPPPPVQEEAPPVEEKMKTLEEEPDIMSYDLQKLNEMGLLKDIFFDFDKYDIRPDQKPRLDENVQTLKKYPNLRILIEGHCDERGSNEYNMALGWKRANTVKDYLIANGIDASRIETISYGEERPFALCHNETCWSQNRRAHFVIIAK